MRYTDTSNNIPITTQQTTQPIINNIVIKTLHLHNPDLRSIKITTSTLQLLNLCFESNSFLISTLHLHNL